MFGLTFCWIVKCAFVSAFRSWNARLCKSWSNLCIWFSPNHNFLEKVAFWAKAKNALRTCKIYGALEVHKAKSPCAFQLFVGLFLQLPNYPEIKSPQFSRLSLIPLISSLCSPFALKLTHAIKLIKPQQ